MFETIKYRLELRKLNKKYDELSKFYAEKEAEAKTTNDREMLHAEAGSEIVPILDEIDSLQSKQFCRLAAKLMVPIPDRKYKEFWRQKQYDYRSILTDKGIWEIKKLIHQEKKERREGFVIWIAVLTGITGIIGAITGLAAVLSL